MQNSRVWIAHPVLFVTLCVICTHAIAELDIPLSSNAELSLGGRLVVQHYDIDLEEDDQKVNESDTDIRRLRPHLKMRWADWRAKLSWELSDRNPNTVKDAYIEYRGFDTLKLKLGNETVPFSRERMTSSSSQQLPERANIGENNWGTPTRVVGLHVEAEFNERWSAYGALGKSDVYSDQQQEIRFLSPWRKHELDNLQLNSGSILATRLDMNIGNGAGYKQSQLKEKNGATFSVAGFYWLGEEDEPTAYEFYEYIYGLELSAGLRYGPWSTDIQTQKTTASVNAHGYSDIVKGEIGFENPSITRGIVADNKAELSHANIDVGYMIVEKRLELALSFGILKSGSKDKEPSFNTGGVWEYDWKYQEAGLSYFFDGHDHKISSSLRKDQHIEGKNENATTLVLQWQFVY